MAVLLILILICTVEKTVIQERCLDPNMHGCQVVLVVTQNPEPSTGIGAVLNERLLEKLLHGDGVVR